MRRKAHKGYWRNRYAANPDEINSAVEMAEADQLKARMRFWQYVGFFAGISYPTNFIRYEEGTKYIYEHSGEEEIDVEFSTSERVDFEAQMEAEGLLGLDTKGIKERMESEMPMGMSFATGSGVLGSANPRRTQ